MAGVIAPSRVKSIGEPQRFIMDWELRVAEHEARHNEYVQDSVKVAALKRIICRRDDNSAELCARGHGEVEGEAEGSDDQIDELRGTRKCRRDDRWIHQRRPGKQPWQAPP